MYKCLTKLGSFFRNYSLNLEGEGERVDILFKKKINFEKFDIYQKTHWRRYEFALDFIKANDNCGDFACGTGYGTLMLAQKANFVKGVDIQETVIKRIQKRYKNRSNVQFIPNNLLLLEFDSDFDRVISFETLEHFEENDILKILGIFHKALKQYGLLIFSTPYLQEASPIALKMGFHKTFAIDEDTIEQWLKRTGFQKISFHYQNYQTFEIRTHLQEKDFIIGIAQKI